MYTIRIHGHSMDQFERCKCSQRDQVTWGMSLSIVSTVVLRLFCNLKPVGMGKSIILLIISAANPPLFGVLSSRKYSEAKIKRGKC